MLLRIYLILACVFENDFIRSDNLKNITGCTVINGHIQILIGSFQRLVAYLDIYFISLTLARSPALFFSLSLCSALPDSRSMAHSAANFLASRSLRSVPPTKKFPL